MRAKRRERQAAPDRFGETNHVGLDAKIFRGPAPAQFRAGFHFVEDQQRAIFVAEITKSLQEAGLRHAQTDVHHDRFEDDGRDLVRDFP